MKKLFLFLVIIIISVNLFSQRLNKITISGNGTSNVYSFLLNENVILNISQDGAITEWGVDKYAGRPIDYIQRKLEAYGGRVEYYNENTYIIISHTKGEHYCFTLPVTIL